MTVTSQSETRRLKEIRLLYVLRGELREEKILYSVRVNFIIVVAARQSDGLP